MYLRKLVVTFAYFVCVVSAAEAQEAMDRATKVQAAIDAVFPGKHFNIRESAQGDINGDGVSDLAVILTYHSLVDPNEERLVVFAGASDESLAPLSVSSEFCNVRMFYNLNIGDASLSVQGFAVANSESSDSFTLNFKYNQYLNDLELIGREDLGRNDEKGSYYKVSVNYLTGDVIHSRGAGKRHREVKARLNERRLIRLQGFDCSSYDSMDPLIYINEDFSIKRW